MKESCAQAPGVARLWGLPIKIGDRGAKRRRSLESRQRRRINNFRPRAKAPFYGVFKIANFAFVRESFFGNRLAKTFFGAASFFFAEPTCYFPMRVIGIMQVVKPEKEINLFSGFRLDIFKCAYCKIASHCGRKRKDLLFGFRLEKVGGDAAVRGVPLRGGGPPRVPSVRPAGVRSSRQPSRAGA